MLWRCALVRAVCFRVGAPDPCNDLKEGAAETTAPFHMWAVPREWPESTVWIVGGGSSLRGFDFERLRGRKTIVINSSIFSVPFADFLFFGDRRWWVHNNHALPPMTGRIVSNSPSVKDERVLSTKKLPPPPGIVDDRTVLPMSWTSTGPAMQLAVHLGARRIMLMGIDLRVGDDGKKYHHAAHPWTPHPKWTGMQMEALSSCVGPLKKRGVEVINTSLESALPFWPKRSLEVCLTEEPPCAAP